MSAAPDPVRRLTVADIARMHADGERLPMLTAYDFPTARILDEVGIPLLLVGDSLGRPPRHDSTVASR
jgi:3-methyl-2-oxobutanoate hydroxymethyltransferase